jgi:p-aminobenzoyl-glutamate transporter AbgT
MDDHFKYLTPICVSVFMVLNISFSALTKEKELQVSDPTIHFYFIVLVCLVFAITYLWLFRKVNQLKNYEAAYNDLYRERKKMKERINQLESKGNITV